MRRLFLGMCLGVFFAPMLPAQDTSHVEVGVFGDYFRLAQTDSNLLGVGARLGVGIFPHVKLEAEMAYDFDQGFGERTSDTSGFVTIQNTDVRMLHGLFGPRVDLGHGRIRPFVVLKGGFEKYFISSCPVTFGCVAGQISNLRANNVNAVLYPGGGLEGHVGPIGLRVEAGDEIYFNHGAHNNLRIAFGPFLRF